MSVGGKSLEGTRKQGATTLWRSHGVEEEVGIVMVVNSGLEDLLLEGSLEEFIGFL